MTDVTIEKTVNEVTVAEDAVTVEPVTETTEVTVNPGISDHGELSGLSDDDHAQYLNNARHGAIGSNPHGVTASETGALPLAGGTMTGDITLPGDPDAALKAATKQYVDAQAGATNLDDLNDVSVPTPTDAQVLTWVDANSQWEAADAGGGGASDVDDLTTDTGSAAEMLRVDGAGTGLEYRTPAQVLADIGAVDKTGDTMTGELSILGSTGETLLEVQDTAHADNHRVTIGVVNSGAFPGIWFNQSSPSTANYAFLAGGSNQTVFNTPSGTPMSFRIGNSRRLQIASGGDIAVGDLAPAVTPRAQMDIDQPSATGAQPVLLLAQADVSEEFIKLIGQSAADASQSLVDAADVPSPGSVVGWFRIYIQDDAGTGPIADGVYFVPFYDAPT